MGRALAEVAGQPVVADEVFPLLFLSEPDAAGHAVRKAVIERLVELEARRVGAFLAEELVEAEVEAVLADFVERVRSSASDPDVEVYVEERFGLDFAAYRAWIRRSVRRSLLLERLVLFELRQHDRVQVQLIRVDSKELAEEVLDKLQRGADFGRLARAHSNDAAAERGGLYPALPTDLGYPLLEKIAELESGERDRVRPVSEAGAVRFRVLQLLARLPAQSGSFAEVHAQIEDELRARVPGSLELDAWMRIVEGRHRVRFHGIGAPGEAAPPASTDRGSE